MEGDIPVMLEQFMSSPLVTWVRTFGQLGDREGNMLYEYTVLVDGIFLNKVMNQINPKGTIQGLNKVNNDVGQRAQNLSVLVYHIKSYYQETLHQLIMMPPPSVLLLGRNPVCEEGLEEIRNLLLLLLGCAVQCERKEEYIEKIQSLDFDTKAAIAAHIQKVTHCQENVFDLHWLETEGLCPEEWENLCRSMSINLKMLVDQRDRQFEAIVELMQGKETMKSVVFGDDSSLKESTSGWLSFSQQHLALELANAKARIKCLRQELEEKSEQLLDCRQDLERVEAEVKRLQQENMQLLIDARTARMYRDELDAMKERAIRADKLESEVARYRDKLHNLNFYKAKLEELKEDNQVLMESKAMLEEELQGVKARSDKLHHLEKHNLLLESKLHDIEEERAVNRRRTEELLERNVILELSQKRTMEESKHLGWELELAKNPKQNSESKSLGQEVTEVTCSRLLKLEKENQRLLKALEELQGTGFISESKHTEENGRTDIVDYKTHKSTPAFTNMHNGQIITPTLKTSNHSLDTEHTSLENTNGNLHCLEVEVHELETEDQSHQINFIQNQLRVDLKNQGLVHENGDLEQDRSCLEKENRRLQQQMKIKEVSLDCSNLKLVVLEKENRTLVKNSNSLSEACTKNKELEKENQELIQQTGVDKRMLMTLREELLDQRLKLHQKESDLENLAYELERMRIHQETRIEDHETVDQGLSHCKQLESELESSLMKSLKIKKERMAALEARLQASAKINQQLRLDLKTVKQKYEALLQRDEEEKAGQCSPPERIWHRESQEATWALLRLKDRLIEVERNNATLQAEKQALQTQLQTLQMQSDGLPAQIIALQQQTASLQESNTTLQTHNAQLQWERQSSEAAIREREDLCTVNEVLLRDHERLSILHERQAAELELLSDRYSTMENSHRTLEIEHRSLEDRYNTLLQQCTQLEELETALREEQQKMQNQICTNRNKTAECKKLRDEKDWLNQTYQKLLAENEELQIEHKSIKSQLNSCKLDQTLLESELSKLKEQNQQLEITSIKLTDQCELLTMLKGNLEEENRHLLDQIQSLMLQIRTLLDQTMESKDLFHVEQRQYIDKLNELRRQKEKLEEKILDQYKFYDPSPPRRRGNWITLKMRKLMKTRTRDQEHVRSSTPQLRSESCEGLDDLRCNHNGSSVGSQGSEESAFNSLNGDTVSPKRSSRKDFQGDTISPRLANGTEGQDHGLNGKSSRAPSASKGEFSVSQKNEAWSSDSSPLPDPFLSSQQRFSDSPSPARPNHEELRQGYCSSRSGVQRTSSGRSTRDCSAQKLDKATIGLYKTQSVQSTESDSKPALETQGKSSSVSGCLNCFVTPVRIRKTGQALSTLPRASCVISTSEGNSRRASVHVPLKSGGSLSNKSGAEPQPHPSDQVLKESPVLEEKDHKPKNLFDSAFTIDSVFTNTIFSE
ncbi:girdin-like isoform X2 [Carassius auratus]|uniref:Girdin-like isoform X2 n=1 Tax=Carassius auratus TaxID=7957 RepID=A0A6P6KD21_CARAU|nr:girdin-like isoform X2 [Carassius auratus]